MSQEDGEWSDSQGGGAPVFPCRGKWTSLRGSGLPHPPGEQCANPGHEAGQNYCVDITLLYWFFRILEKQIRFGRVDQPLIVVRSKENYLIFFVEYIKLICFQVRIQFGSDRSPRCQDVCPCDIMLKRPPKELKRENLIK